MSIIREIEKNNIPFNTLEDETLVSMFRELNLIKESDKRMIREILKTLMLRKKLFLLSNSIRNNYYKS